MIKMRKKMFGNSGGSVWICFVDRASMFVVAVFETSLSFCYVL